MASLRIKMAALALLLALFNGVNPSVLTAQWRISNSPETITVLPDGKTVNSAMQLTVGVDMYVQVSGAFSLFNGQAADGIDAAYTYRVPNWNIFTPLSNPPTYQNTTFKWGFEYSNNGSTFKPFYNPPANAPAYQNSHNYTARIPFIGNKFGFRIVAPSASYFSAGTGKLFVKLTRFTAGLCVKSDSIDFKQVQVQKNKIYLDSLASYGIDPLSVDSIKIFGSPDFSFQSSRGNSSFTLATQTASELAITVTPTSTGQLYGEIHIYCHNADAQNKDRKIKLHAEGTAPNANVGPDSLNWGKVRIKYPTPGSNIKSTNVSNPNGTAELVIDQATYTPLLNYTAADNIFASASGLPIHATPNSVLTHKTIFAPLARKHYQGTLSLSGPGTKVFKIDLQGDGAEPVPELSTKLINFGSVFKGDSVSKSFTLTNKGNWTCTVIDAHIESANKAVFSFSPAESTFYVEPDSIRTMTVTFKPGTSQNWTLTGNLIFVYDDNTRDTVVLNGTEVQPKYLLKNHLYDFGKVRIGKPQQPRPVDTITAPNTIVTMQPLELKQPPNFFSLTDPSQSRQFQVKPGNDVQLWAKFEPIIVGPWKTYLYVNDSYKKDSIELRGIGAIAKAIFNPNPLSFGTVPSNTNTDATTTLTDSGDYPLNILRYEITGPDKDDFSVRFQSQGGATPDSTSIYHLSEGASMPIQVRFFTNAKTGLVHRATLCLYYDDSSSDCIPLEAIEEAQFLQFGQTSVDFGKVRVGDTQPKKAKFANNSGKTLTVDSIFTDPNPIFKASKTALSVNKGIIDSTSIDVSFSPPTRGAFTGLLTGRGGDFKESSIELRGIGAAPMPFFSPDTLQFGIVKLNSSSIKSFFLIDTGDWTLKVVDIAIVGNPYYEFSYIQDKTGNPEKTDSIFEQDKSSYTVNFTPNQTIVYHEAKMVFTFDDGTKGFVTLIGYDESDHLVLDNDTLNFGKVRIGAPINNTVTLVSTSPDTLIAENVHLDGAPEFTASPLGKIVVPPRHLPDITVTCTPTTIGPLSAQLITDICIGSSQDTTFIIAEGAMPVASFPSDTLDFGLNFNGRSVTKTIDLTNKGNWDLSVVSYAIGGSESQDFTTPTIPQSFIIAEQADSVLSITFKASTPYQPTTRMGEIDFTLDDGSIFKLYLKAQDIEPIKVDLKFDNSNMRIEDKVYPYLRLMTPIPDSLNLNHIHGIVTYDPAVVSAPISVHQSGALEKTRQWILTTNTNPSGQYEYDLQSATEHLSSAGPILQFEFQAANGARVGDQTILQHTLLELPTRTEFVIQERQGIIVIDSACGSTHLLQGGKAQTSYIEMNSPNPFGSGTFNESTNMTFAVANDGTPVTLRILDITGKEVLRPLDQQVFAQGYFKITLSANDLPNSGTYLYEFRAGNERPTVRKMIVRK